MIKEYLTVSGETENLIVIERSKFICSIKGVANEEEAKLFVESIRKKHSLATHNCYAYIADDKGLIQKFSDDGEPQGTAGLPMLEVLRNKRIYKTVAVVTRYFGGVKLGTGGLTRAYSGSVVSCLENAKILNMQPAMNCTTTVDYDLYSILLKLISTPEIFVSDTVFDNSVTVSLAVKVDYFDVFEKRITESFNGKVFINKQNVDYFPFR